MGARFWTFLRTGELIVSCCAVAISLAGAQLCFADEVTGQALKTIHDPLYDAEKYPSAQQCASCHPTQFKEWASSPHAYAQLSPVFNAMHRKLVKETNGTQGDFCIRCHTPQGIEAGEPISGDNMKRSTVSLEGVTCVTCHRRSEPLGKVSGRFNLEQGNILKPVHGPFDNEELRRVIESGEFDVVAEDGKPGRKIHADAKYFAQISTSAFCGSCHDVNNFTGFRLEEAFSEYVNSPAAKRGVQCQDCHMSQIPGTESGFSHEPIALVAGKPTKTRKHADHSFVGPDYSIVHPGLFPHNFAARKLATIEEWVAFDYKAGWGTPDFEDAVTEDLKFPDRWKDAADRFDARAIIEENQAELDRVAEKRKTLLRNGYQLGEVHITRSEKEQGLAFAVDFENGTDGHNVPTGFDAERPVFLRIQVLDAHKKIVFQSGDLDPNGDLRDSHSRYVHDGKLPKDEFLFSLQSKFIVDLIRGGEREQVLPINHSRSPLPFIRPPTNATSLKGRPEGARKHRQTIAPLATKRVPYEVSAEELAKHQAPFTIKVAIVAGMVPVSLVHAIQDVGFDYGMSPREVAEAIVAGHQVLWEREIQVNELK